MICEKCQTQLAGSPKFCPKCGAKAPGQPRPGPLVDPDQGGDEVALTAVARLNDAQAPVSTATAGSAAPGDVLCPVCRTRNPAAAKFCKKDGAPLHGSAPTGAAAPPRMPSRPAGGRRVPPRAMVAAGGAVVVAIAALTGGSLYWTGYIGDRQGVIAQEINTQLGSKGLGNVKSPR